MKHTIFILFFLLVVPPLLHAQKPPRIEWQRCLGGSKDEDGDRTLQTIIQTSDGGYVIAGRTNSLDGDVKGIHGGNFDDILVAKLSSSNTIEWQKCLGGTGSDKPYCIIQTSDKGFAIAGFTGSTDGDISGFHGGTTDSWIVKLDSIGIIQWQKCIGGSDSGGRDLFEIAYSIIQTSDGGYAIAGSTLSTTGDFQGKTHGGGDAFVAKLDISGNTEWIRCYGGIMQEVTKSIIQNSDGGFTVAGFTFSNEEAFPNHAPLNTFTSDGYVIRIDSLGEIIHGSDNKLWQKLIGGKSNEELNCIIHATDGGFLVAGVTYSNDGDVSGNHGSGEAWIIKLNTDGGIEWQKCFGGAGYEEIVSIIESPDSGYVFCGFSSSNNGDISGNHGGIDVWVVKITSTGVIQWQKCLGGSAEDNGFTIIQTSDGGYAVSGRTNSNDGDVSGWHANSDLKNPKYDMWVVKLSNPLDVQNAILTSDFSLSTYPNPTTQTTTLSYDLPNSSAVSIGIYTVTGERIKHIQLPFEESGHHELPIDLGGYSEGTYFIRLSADGIMQTKAVQVMK